MPLLCLSKRCCQLVSGTQLEFKKGFMMLDKCISYWNIFFTSWYDWTSILLLLKGFLKKMIFFDILNLLFILKYKKLPYCLYMCSLLIYRYMVNEIEEDAAKSDELLFKITTKISVWIICCFSFYCISLCFLIEANIENHNLISIRSFNKWVNFISYFCTLIFLIYIIITYFKIKVSSVRTGYLCY
jgi:hypothetical protein